MKFVKTVFLDVKDRLPKNYKSYNYLIDDILVNGLDIGLRDGDKWVEYEITNNDGFNYRGSKVIFIAYKDVEKDEEIVGYKRLIKVNVKGITNFLGDAGLKNVNDERAKLVREGWKLTNQVVNNIMGSYNAVNNTNCCTTSSTTTNGTVTADPPYPPYFKWNDNSNITIVPNTISTTGWVSNYPTYDEINEIKRRLDKIENKNRDEKENKKMFESLTKNLKCGRAQDVRMSIYGPAFKGEDGNWYAVGTDDVLTDVSDLLLDMDSYCYMMPVAKNQVKEGDFILHNGRWTKVISVDKEKVDGALDIFKKEFIVPVLTKSPFGFEFYTKLVPLLDFSKFQADTNTPFGALPMILMMNNKDDKDMLPMLMMMGTQGGFNFDMSNPMMMYFLMKDGEKDNLLPFLMMNQMNKAND